VDAVAPIQEISDLVRANGGASFQFCYQCGICDVVCPWNRVRAFSMRKIVRQAAFGLTEIEGEDIWRCTTCGTCPQRCPRGVRQIELGVSLRRIATEYGVFPDSVSPVVTVGASLMAEGNPFDLERAKRADWAEGLPVKTFTEGMEILYFPGCYLSYDPRLKKVAAATARILAKAGVDFGILGPEESCCGESIRKTGNEQAYRHLARRNIKAFIDHGVKKILVSSPHCFHTFRNEYPEFSVNFEIVHISQYLCELSGPAQRGLRRAARGTGSRARRAADRDGGTEGKQLLLRRRRRPDLDGDFQGRAVLRSAAETGRRHRGRGAGDRLPLLHHQFHRQRAGPGAWQIDRDQGHYGSGPGNPLNRSLKRSDE
jgi:heterodisulfide reductase subunit C